MISEKRSVDLPQCPTRAAGPDPVDGLPKLLVMFKVALFRFDQASGKEHPNRPNVDDWHRFGVNEVKKGRASRSSYAR